MSIRVATLNFTTSPFAMVGSSEPPYYTPWSVATPYFPADMNSWVDSFDPVFEASPIYTQIEVRVQITGGDFDGLDETVVFTREPIATGSGIAPSNPDSIYGFDAGDGMAAISAYGMCKMCVGMEVRGDNGIYSDPKKQQMIIVGNYDLYPLDFYVFPPQFRYDSSPWPATGTRESSTKWGYGTAAGQYVDASSWSDTKWRDYSGTYSATVVGGIFGGGIGGTAIYDWTLS